MGCKKPPANRIHAHEPHLPSPLVHRRSSCLAVRRLAPKAAGWATWCAVCWAVWWAPEYAVLCHVLRAFRPTQVLVPDPEAPVPPATRLTAVANPQTLRNACQESAASVPSSHENPPQSATAPELASPDAVHRASDPIDSRGAGGITAGTPLFLSNFRVKLPPDWLPGW